MVKFEVENRLSGGVQFTAEIDCGEINSRSFKMGLAVKWAVKNGVDLEGADLSGAYLGYTNLSGADLSGADLSGADLSDTCLRGAYLEDAYIRGADLSRADLSRADLGRADLSGAYLSDTCLRGAYLSSADLSGADLRGANFSGAYLGYTNLSGADLRGANLRGASLGDTNLRSFKACLWMTLSENPNEAQGVADALREGRVNGSRYSGKCACLVGTIANVRGVDAGTLPKNSNHPSEQWFLMIKEGDTPDKDTGGGFAAKMALEWVGEWLAKQSIINA